MSQNDVTFATPAPGKRDESAFRSLVRTYGLLKRVMEPYFAQFGISGSQWSVLRTLHRCREAGEPELRLSELGNRLIVRPASVTGVVDRLERMGMVDRVTAPDDQRVKHVSLTSRGEDLVRRVLEHHPQQISSVLGGLSDTEQDELGRLLERLEPHLSQMADQHEPSASIR